MGQKINPQSLRTGIVKDWDSRWFFTALPDQAKGGGLMPRKRLYAKFLEEDELIRKTVVAKIAQSGIAGIVIERTPNEARVFIKAARPGFIIGRGGKGIEELSEAIVKAVKKLRGPQYKGRIAVNVEELKRSEVSAAHTAQLVAWDIEKRLPYRRAMKKYLEQLAQNRDVKGAKIFLSGRLGGGEIARRETAKHGALPLQTLRANIDYGTATARTTYGAIGIKVWIYKGQTLRRLNQN